ncbi:hypothetical protein CHUAL_008242 [Chamberlinius hualienensis]
MSRLIYSLAVLGSLLAAVHMQLLSFNYDIFLNDKSYVQSQLACVLGEKEFQTCDRIGNRLRMNILPDAAKSGKCQICNPQEKIYVVKVARKIKTSYPAEWNRIMDIYKVEPSLRETFLQAEITN